MHYTVNPAFSNGLTGAQRAELRFLTAIAIHFERLSRATWFSLTFFQLRGPSVQQRGIKNFKRCQI
jgi:hypothetical protein